ncbi:MAG: aminotransferase class IV [Cyclobacteriaceae bacterium]
MVAPSTLPCSLQKQGFDQVFWTDAQEHKYIDESGAMNVMFVINGKVVTPKLTSSLLDGVTRDSILSLTSALGIEKEERRIGVAEIEEGLKNGKLTEAFGVGTAAVVSRLHPSAFKEKIINSAAGADSFKHAKKKLNDIRMGTEARCSRMESLREIIIE